MLVAGTNLASNERSRRPVVEVVKLRMDGCSRPVHPGFVPASSVCCQASQLLLPKTSPSSQRWELIVGACVFPFRLPINTPIILPGPHNKARESDCQPVPENPDDYRLWRRVTRSPPVQRVSYQFHVESATQCQMRAIESVSQTLQKRKQQTSSTKTHTLALSVLHCISSTGTQPANLR